MSRRKRIVESSSEEESSDTSSAEEYVPTKSARHTGSQKQRVLPQTKLKSSSQRAELTADRGLELSQEHGSQLSEQCSELSQEEFSRCAGLVANYFLTAECKKVPVKRTDLIKVVGKQHTRKLPLFIDEASALLQKIYGYKILELQQRKNAFILHNLLAPPINCITGSNVLSNGAADSSEDTEDDGREAGQQRQLADDGDERQGFLFTILIVVFMMGGVVEEVTLLSFLKSLGVYVDGKDPHAVFGNSKKLIEEFVRQCWLDVTVLKDQEPPGRQYCWGERAELQCCKKTVLEFVCKLYGGGMRPENWTDHWARVVGTVSASTSSSMGSSVEEITDS